MNKRQHIKALHLFVTATRSARVAVKNTRNSYITPLCAIGMSPGCRSIDIARVMEIKKQSAHARVSNLYLCGYIIKDKDKGLHLTEQGEIVYSSVMRIFGPVLNNVVRDMVRMAAKYRKEQEQRRPEKGEIVLLYDGCPPDLLTRQRKRKQKTKRVKS